MRVTNTGKWSHPDDVTLSDTSRYTSRGFDVTVCYDPRVGVWLDCRPGAEGRGIVRPWREPAAGGPLLDAGERVAA